MDELKKRGHALEEKFFADRDAKAVAELRAKLEKQELTAALAEHTGIENAELLQGLVEFGVSVSTLVVVRIIPLVLMSWASGSVESNEREILMNHLHSKGIGTDSPVRTLINGWLNQKPESSLETTWAEFMNAYVPTLEASAKEQFKSEVLSLATDIAEADGGFLGFGSVSQEEKNLQTRLEALFA